MHARTRAFSSLKGATLSASPTNWHCSSILLGYLGVSRIKDKSTSLPTQPRMISEIQAFQSSTGLSKGWLNENRMRVRLVDKSRSSSSSSFPTLPHRFFGRLGAPH